MKKVIASVLFACVCVGLVLASLNLDLWTCRCSAMLPQPMAAQQPLLDRLMAKQPSARYPSADELLADLGPLVAAVA